MEKKLLGMFFLFSLALTANAMPASSSFQDRENFDNSGDFDVNAKSTSFPHMTLLQKAAINGNVESVRCLIKAGANVNAEDDINNTALDYIIEQLDYGLEQDFVEKLMETAALLINAGAIVKDKDYLGLIHPQTEPFKALIAPYLSRKK
ncbi:ankyrin repeat domain-containing protein [Candidatus Babeliales bacterium]|nr:ankyrin repeat domain-containing protein [Candidatus Babeliales bacterium]